jgi:amino acid adenylation domain-containing protein
MMLPPGLLDAFAHSVRRRGTHVAVEAKDGPLTYVELDKRSSQLANRLRVLGVTAESRVGISLQRGALELVAMLATLKAGGAYVPLDPSHPTERLQAIIEDAQPQVMLVHPGSALAATSVKCLVVLEGLDDATRGQPLTAPAPAAAPENLAYILFTSGSTGRPKGVEITRAAFDNFLASMAKKPGLGQHERVLAITTTSFDIAGLELFLPLYVGATTVIVDRATAQDPRALRARLDRGDITLLQATPATWRLLLDAGWRGNATLRMLCGGEALSSSLADRLLSCGAELWNMYGPTETTVWSSLEPIRAGYDIITIGRPIDETQLYVLDEAMRPVPAGHEGEIWIGGKGLARGYRGRADLTAERFRQNPGGPPGDRIYRTGDLGRALHDGRFECLGRLDHQVKIRGFRIELGEIEAVLRGVPGVREALVIADQYQGEPTLIAYSVGTADRQALIKATQEKLPPYMVPSTYVALEAFPLNTNGKIDRKRLPKPQAMPRARAPQGRLATELEVRIQNVWAQVLGLHNVPLDQSFFTLGGNSALAVKAVATIERELQIELPLQALYTAPTVEGLAATLHTKVSADAPIVARLREGQTGKPPLLCLYGVTLYQDLAIELGQDRPVFGMHIPIRYVPGREAPPNLEDIGARYVQQIRVCQDHGPYHLLGLCFGGIVAYEVASQLIAAGEEVATVTVIDAVLPHAVSVDEARRLLALARLAFDHPSKFLEKMRGRFGQLYARSPLGRLAQRKSEPVAEPQAVNLPVDGPEADAEAARFGSRPVKLPTRLLIVRATQDERPPWMTVAPDHGWNERADTLLVRDVPSDHLGVLAEPHVRTLAQAVDEVSRPS